MGKESAVELLLQSVALLLEDTHSFLEFLELAQENRFFFLVVAESLPQSSKVRGFLLT